MRPLTDDIVLAALAESPWERMQVEVPEFAPEEVSQAINALLYVETGEDVYIDTSAFDEEDDAPTIRDVGPRTIRVSTDLAWSMERS